MSGFIAFIGWTTIILCTIGGGYILNTSPDLLKGLGIELIVGGIVSGSLLLGFSELLTWVKGIHDSTVDTETGRIDDWYYPTFGASPLSFRCILNRTKGRWGATYAFKDSGDQVIDPTFLTRDEVMAAIRAGIKASLASTGTECSSEPEERV